MALPRIRTMQQAYECIKADDPETSLSFFAFRNLIISGAIASHRNGQRYLINMADVERYFCEPETNKEEAIPYPGIRAVAQ